jgi:DTW domain-containing protein YfiP
LDNRTRVHVVQHPRERFHPVGTVRLLELGLTQVSVDVAYLEVDATRPARFGPRAMLLYPAPDAPDVRTLREDERPDELVVIDGTWHHAHTLHRDMPWLRALPAVTLAPTRPSRYRIRLEPRAECLSTVEAVVETLRILEPETRGFDALLTAFDTMVDDQLAFVRSKAGARRARKRSRPARALPRALAERFADLVVVYAETALCAGRIAGPRRLVQLAALRVASGELFETFLRSEAPPGLHHMRLAPQAVAAGGSLEAVRAAWQQFRRPRDRIAAWNQSTLDALADAGLEPHGILLKGVYANAIRRGPGALEAVLADEALRPQPLPLQGRASERLANVAEIARLLHRRAIEASAL